MLLQDKNKAAKKEILEAIGKNIQGFKLKLTHLRDKWTSIANHGIGDCHEVRVISKVLFRNLTPINAAIIADNVDYFKKHHVRSLEVNQNLLEITCLCGAEKITEFLLKSEKDPLARYDFILSYAGSSMNEEWTKKIATEMNERNIEIPNSVYLLCDRKIKGIIHDIYKDNSLLFKI